MDVGELADIDHLQRTGVVPPPDYRRDVEPTARDVRRRQDAEHRDFVARHPDLFFCLARKAACTGSASPASTPPPGNASCPA